jgi:hypothetical protein
MAIFSNSIIPAAAAAADDDVITKSVRFNRADDPYISFTPSSTGNQKKWTTAMWIKKSAVGLSSAQYFGLTCDEHSGEHNNGVAGIYFGGGDDKIDTYFDTDGSNPYGNINDRVYRDPAGWMQIIWAVDAANTVQRIWVNGVEETASSSLNPLDYAYAMNKSGHLMAIGTSAWGVGNCFDGYIAQVVHLDGQYITDPTEFGQVSSTTGEWEPIEITSSSFTYGTNGALLEFLQTGTSADSSGIGADTSGNDNHWSVSSIAASDVVEDTPTDNYCTLNPLDTNSNNVLAEGNLNFSSSGSSNHYPTFSTMGMRSGKWYFEAYKANGSSWMMAIMSLAHDSGSLSADSTVGNTTSGVNKVGYSISAYNGNKSHDSGSEYDQSYGSATGDVLMCAFDADNGKIWWGTDGTWFDSGDPAAGTDYAFNNIDTDTDWGVCIHCYSGNLPWMNFGADPTFGGNISSPATDEFKYTPPSGFKSLKASNLTASIAKPSEYFDVKTWTGTATSPTPAAKVLDFPWSFATDGGLVWQKMRNSSGSHYLFDTVRGDDKGLYTNTTDAEQGNYPSYYTQDFDSSGDYSIQQDFDGGGNGNEVNLAGNTYVAWSWKESATAGFDIITWTGDGETGGQEVSHGLTVVPEMIIAKDRSAAMGSGDWVVHHKDLSHSTLNKYLVLNGDDAETGYEGLDAIGSLTSSSITFDDDMAFLGTSRLLNTGTMFGMQAASTYVAYVFASVEGYSKVGSYTGNGSSDGPFINLGFRPAFVLYKKISSDSPSWGMRDSARETYNSGADGDILYAESNAAEDHNHQLDFVSNGIKLRGSYTGYNDSGVKYLFYAVAESPLKTANAR